MKNYKGFGWCYFIPEQIQYSSGKKMEYAVSLWAGFDFIFLLGGLGSSRISTESLRYFLETFLFDRPYL